MAHWSWVSEFGIEIVRKQYWKSLCQWSVVTELLKVISKTFNVKIICTEVKKKNLS
jgi:hypothetical protein